MWAKLGMLLVGPVLKWLGRRQSRKDVAQEIQGKIAVSKQRGESFITVGTESWEALSKNAENGTWKDEYVTLVITAPIVLIIAGSVMVAFTGDPALLDGATSAIKTLVEVGVPMDTLMTVVVTAAISIKVLREK